MIAVIFEVEPATGRADDYLAIAASLRPRLDQIDGFISIERFRSLTQPDKLLSLSFFRDEAAIAAWRRIDAHRHAQTTGRAGIFADYRLRIASVVRDYGMNERREQAPADSRCVHDGRAGRDRSASRSPGRFTATGTLCAHVLMRAWTFIAFVPQALAFERAAPDEVDPVAARRWTRRSCWRFILDVTTLAACLVAFAAAGQS